MKEPSRDLTDAIVSDLRAAAPDIPVIAADIVLPPPGAAGPALLRLRLNRETVRWLNELPPKLQEQIAKLMLFTSSSGS